jgi:hypothetical protein
MLPYVCLSHETEAFYPLLLMLLNRLGVLLYLEHRWSEAIYALRSVRVGIL